MEHLASESHNRIQGFKLAGVNLRQAIQVPSRGLVVASLQDRLDQVAQLAADLGQRIALPEAEELKMISRETGPAA